MRNVLIATIHMNIGKKDEDRVEGLMKRVKANDAGAIYVLGNYYRHGKVGLHQYRMKSRQLNYGNKLRNLGPVGQTHFGLGGIYEYEEEDLKKAKFHYEVVASCYGWDMKWPKIQPWTHGGFHASTWVCR